MNCPNCGRSFEDHTTCGCWIPVSGQITSPKSCAAGGLPEHWTAIEARKKRELVIRKDEREKVLREFAEWVLHDLVYCYSIGVDHMFSHEMILDKIDELRHEDGE
jgi:hypothetical protein